jgi:DNA-binding NarL/FixJ family response regulator
LRHPDVGIVLFPVQLADDQVERALACGAGGVVLKSAPILEVLEALATVARGGTIVGADVVEGSAAADLSIREREVVGLLANGMSNRDISASLLISIGTTKRHVENIARKLGTSSRAAAAAAAIRRGLVA